MKKILTFLTAAALTVLFVVACKKFNDKKDNSAPFNITEAKTWYSEHFPATTNSPEGSLNIQWDKSRFKAVRDMEIIEVPYLSTRTKVRLQKRPGSTNDELKSIATASIQTIVFMKRDGRIWALAKQYIPDLTYLKEQGFNAGNQNGLPKDNFDGEVWLSSLNGKAISVSRLQNNRVIQSFRTKAVSSALRDGSASRTECEWVEVCEYVRWCCYAAQGCWGLPAGHCTEWINTGNCMEMEFCEPISCEEEPEYCACEIYGECGSGDDPGDPDPNAPPVPPVTTQVIDSLTSDCLKSVLATIGNEKLKNQIIKLYTQTFVGTNKVFNVRFQQAPNLMSGSNVAPALSQVDPNNSSTWVITFNSSLLNLGISKETWTQVLLHELIHGFMRQNNIGFDSTANFTQEHEDIVTDWVIQLRDALVEICNISSTDALGLALSGVDDVLREEMSGFFLTDWEEYVQEHYAISLGVASAIEQDYLDGVKGTVCEN